MRSGTRHRDPRARAARGPRTRAAAAGALTLLLLALLVATATGCFGKDDPASTQSGTVTSGEVKAVVGKSVTLGKAAVVVSSLAPTQQPALPDVTMSRGGWPAPAEGEVYYQARVRVANAGKKPVRVDPWDFVLVSGDAVHSLEPGASGPPARSLLPGTSLSLILSYRVPAGTTPVLVYEPEWFPGSLRVTGERAPAGQAKTAPAGG